MSFTRPLLQFSRARGLVSPILRSLPCFELRSHQTSGLLSSSSFNPQKGNTHERGHPFGLTPFRPFSTSSKNVPSEDAVPLNAPKDSGSRFEVCLRWLQDNCPEDEEIKSAVAQSLLLLDKHDFKGLHVVPPFLPSSVTAEEINNALKGVNSAIVSFQLALFFEGQPRKNSVGEGDEREKRLVTKTDIMEFCLKHLKGLCSFLSDTLVSRGTAQRPLLSPPRASLTASGIIRSIESWLEDTTISEEERKARKSQMKARCTSPLRLSVRSFGPHRFINEDIPLQAISRMLARKAARDGALVGDKSTDPLVGLHSPPGGGKSFSLDIISEIGQDQVQLDQLFAQFPAWQAETMLVRRAGENNFDDDKKNKHLEELHCLLKKSVGITLTHIHGSGPLNEEKNDELFDEFVGWRILCSYFSTLSLVEFVRTFRPMFFLSSKLAIEVVMEHAKKEDRSPGQIILCVDEIMASHNTDQFVTILGSLLDTFPSLSVFVSTLNAHYINSTQVINGFQQVPSQSLRTSSPSGRGLKWISIDPIPTHRAVEMFKKNGHDPLKLPFLYNAICMSNGHPRTLQFIKETVEVHQFTKHTSMDAFNLAFRDSALDLGKPLDSLMVALALSGQRVAIDELHDSKGFDKVPPSYNHLLQMGHFLNSMSSSRQESFNPQLSLMRLRFQFFDELYFKNHGLNVEQLEPLWRFQSLKEIVDKPIPIPNDGAISHSDYLEVFQGLWEDCKRVSLGILAERNARREKTEGHALPLTSTTVQLCRGIYGVIADQRDVSDQGLLIGEDNDVVITVNRSGPVKSFSKYSDLSSVLRGPDLYRHVFRPANPINKGFDLFIVEQSPNGTPFLVLIECKSWSTKDSDEDQDQVDPTTLSRKDVRKKIKHSINQFQTLFKGTKKGGIGGLDDLSQLYIVFASTKKISKETMLAIKSEFETVKKRKRSTDQQAIFNKRDFPRLPPSLPNIVFLPRNKLMSLYTPTLSNVPCFLTSEEIENQCLPNLAGSGKTKGKKEARLSTPTPTKD
eukprot:TRINITY_DN4851_c0_g1_i1.p1 TRINITY_DN4851_c0_g1~~TRINITY_DN4851_c0_g1_i1.p1  ORF type:complete len:1019 (+),score=178.00 TRINITY_DN4851_c0_g1_i1:79-3135(+)